ncbi:tRNA (adenosine(37)-N6)-dimethylallyltransferase MiaA [Candidatus Jorgensenbacteria bacterium GWC1_48_12]|uniref:tRNA dimethylallyltransferase n=1 Tax=Candidatus Jorgensenbacteria bacterium GWC1_48_12 TaxID=1798469 RepID=A0A1F6BRL3_9BACT|nr:MAG: tRNA (adenosine(37)-N6)-dimethylallyltransferase MiaA [Candidatus Jorgensenbacteria bacterium GWC1_48_12]
MKKIIAIIGPTASGKTALAVRLAKKFGGELISADSRQIYKGMDIGTAKDKSYPQYLVDSLSPKTTFNVLRFKNLCLRNIREVSKKNKLPILVGGSGLYLNVVLYNLKIPKVRADEYLRIKLEKLALGELEKRLKKLDPEAARITAGNKRRIIRALEVIAKTGKPFSEQRKKGKPLFDTLVIGIKVPREKLYERIEKRIDEQIKKGLVGEVKNLVKKYGKNTYALRGTIAYKELIPYLSGETTLESAIQEIKKNSRRFSRRQMTWFRAQPDVRWVDSFKETEKLIRKFLKN